MTSLYVVNYTGGGYGNFIASLLICSISNQSSTVRYSETGNAHDYYHSYIKNNASNYNEKLYREYHKSEYFTKLKSTDPKMPLVLVTPDPNLDYSLIFETDPNFKIIIIKAEGSDLLQLEYNHFYKNYLHQELSPANVYWNDYLSESESNPKIRKGLSSLIQLSPEERLVLINRRRRYSPPRYEIPNEYQSHVCYIKAFDVINNKDEVLKTLHECTGMKITPAIIDSYDNYLSLQCRYKLP